MAAMMLISIMHKAIIKICDWSLEKRSKSHNRSFETNGFKEFKAA